MRWLILGLGAICLCAVALLFWRFLDSRAERAVWNELLRLSGPGDARFQLPSITSLPEPAQRYFRYTIAPGAPLVSVAVIDMEGELGLGTREAPAYRSMSARQILAPPQGFLWRLRTGALSGSDALTPDVSWTRFWMFNFIPVVRADGSDHHHSAFGRVVAEGAFWVPACLLPGEGVVWEAVDDNTARAIVSHGPYRQSIELSVEADGQPSRVLIQRWSNENPERTFRAQPFGGYLSDFQEVQGYRLPMRVEGGNHIGTDDYFPFYRARVREIRFPQLGD